MKPGDKLGPYEILAPLGAGGMGEVYRARDTKLQREVAVKVLPEAFAADPDRAVRFTREALLLASLNHPGIAHIYGVEERALVMELVPGPTLAERIAAGPIPLEEALPMAVQIAEAVEYAHDHNVMHRDLKPANIKITPEGTVKVLDFGLAKALADDPDTSDPRNSPTLTLTATRAGVVLGTAAYMAPEQAKGKPVDRRTDIWAYGAVLYEMLTGKPLHEGETVAETMASVIMKDVKLDALPADTPPAIRALLKRCLEKDPKQRLQAIGEARIVLAGPLEPAGGTERPAQAKARATWIPWALSGALLLAFAALAVWHFRPLPAPAITKFPILLGEGQQFNTNTARVFVALSADGTQMVYGANNRLYLRQMADLAARAIPGTDTNRAIANPVFSPDGRSVAYFLTGEAAIKRIAISGGTAVTICPATAPLGMSWGPDGIVFSQGVLGILRVSENGGKPELLVKLKEGQLAAGPQMLPDGENILFTLATGNSVGTTEWDKAQIVVQNLKSGVRKVVHDGGSDARYLPTGHLVYGLGGTLFAIAFDARRLEATGGAVPLVEGIMRMGAGATEFSFSKTGSLIYVLGPAATGSSQASLARIDRKGAIEPFKLPAGAYDFPRVSRDGKRIAYQIDDGKGSAIWTYALSGETAPSRLTLAGVNRYPIWSADAERVAFQSDREGDLGIWWQRADGVGTAERLTKAEKGTEHIPDSWTKDNQTFSYTQFKTDTDSSVWTYSLRDKKATLFASAPGTGMGRSAFSPDGRWLAYQVRNAGEREIYVQPFPASATRFVVPKIDDTHHPLWSPNGKELFYIAGNRRLVTVSVATQPAVTFGTPVEQPTGFNTYGGNNVRNFDILPDGAHFLGMATSVQGSAGSATPQIQVVLNWFEDVKQRAPGR